MQKLFCVTDYSILEFSGKDAEIFLQGQTTQDIKKINGTQAKLGAFCNSKGKVIAIFDALRVKNGFWLRLPQDIIPLLLQHLHKYTPLFRQLEITFREDIVIATSDSLYTNLKLALKTANIYEYWLENNEFIPVEFNEDWLNNRIANKIASIHPHTSELFTPHALELQMVDGVSFTKGCYIGQEIIARTQYLGKSKHRLFIQKNTAEITMKDSTLLDNTSTLSLYTGHRKQRRY